MAMLTSLLRRQRLCCLVELARQAPPGFAIATSALPRIAIFNNARWR
jgi:hypothetical protein